jgi:uncharacterized protein
MEPLVLSAVQKVAGPGARLVQDESLCRFDILPLLVATDGAIAEFRRPNIVAGAVSGMAERGWQGGRLSIGKVVIGIEDLRGRCVMTTFDPDTLAHDPQVLKDIIKRFGGKLALNCYVVQGGEIRVNQRSLPLARLADIEIFAGKNARASFHLVGITLLLFGFE